MLFKNNLLKFKYKYKITITNNLNNEIIYNYSEKIKTNKKPTL